MNDREKKNKNKQLGFKRPKFDRHAPPWKLNSTGQLERDDMAVSKTGKKFMTKISSVINSGNIEKNAHKLTPKLIDDINEDMAMMGDCFDNYINEDDPEFLDQAAEIAEELVSTFKNLAKECRGERPDTDINIDKDF